MKIIFDEMFIRENYLLFVVASIITILMILVICYFGIKEIKKNVRK